MKTVRRNLLALICLGVLILLLTNSSLFAQDKSSGTEERHFWANVGGGGSWVRSGLGEDEGGISGGISFSYQTGSNLFSIRGVENEEFKLDLFGYTGPPDKVWDMGVLYGRVAKASWGLASISGGVGIVGASEYEGSSSLHMGIPVEGQLFWTPSYRLGIGIYGFANLNTEKSFAGALLCLQIGRLR